MVELRARQQTKIAAPSLNQCSHSEKHLRQIANDFYLYLCDLCDLLRINHWVHGRSPQKDAKIAEIQWQQEHIRMSQ
jgi:hypothetical protein